ncbi:MAG TPA: Ig-like domain-containing protein, partial [Candidatus Mucispirillum faecigallinarum]|nr:Ig-like domain-containing protein [Candidatus Mucispirillum faecigallinarum]
YDLVPGQSHVVETPVSVTDIQVSGAQQLDRRINAKYTLNPVVLPVNASNKAVTYSTSNEQVATVSPTGVVTGLNSGSADIIVTSVSNNEVIGTTQFTVIDSTKRVEDIVFSNTDTNLLVGSPVTVQASAVPSDATYNDITYYSKNPTVATVNSATGVVTPRRVGTVEIAAVSDKGSFEKSITLNVGISEQTEPVRGIINIPSKLEVSLESQTPVQLNGQVVPTYADDTTLTYKADESGCVSVDENGLVSALKVGTGIVTVSSSKYPDIKKEVSIAVRQNEEKIYVTSINVNQAPSVLYIGHTSHTIIPEIVPSNANMENELTVSIDDKTVASLEQVGNGYKVTPLKEGSVIVTLQTANGVTQEVPLSVKKVMNVKGYYTISKVEYTLGTKTETLTAENDKLQGEFAIDLLTDKYTIKGRLQFTPKNPLTSYTFNNWRYLYESKEIMLDTADKYSSQTKEVLASQDINITSGTTIEYTYTQDSLKAVIYLTKVNDNTKDILDRTMYVTPVNMASDPHSAEGYYEMTWFYGNSLNTAMLERYPAIYSSSKDEMPTSSDIGITYHKECPDPTAWYDWSACFSGGGGENGSVTNYSGAFAVKVDGTEANAQIKSIAKVQMQGHQNFNLSSWLKYIHATFDPLTLSQSTASDGKIVSQNLNARIITNSEDEGSQGAYLAYTQLNNNQMQFEMQFLSNYKFMYRATKVSDRYVDLPTDRYSSGDISGRNPPARPELAQVVAVESFTGTVTPIEE